MRVDYAPSDEKLDGQVQYLRASSSRVRNPLSKPAKKKGKKQEAPSGPHNNTLYYTAQLPEWRIVLELERVCGVQGHTDGQQDVVWSDPGPSCVQEQTCSEKRHYAANAVREDYVKAAPRRSTNPFDEAQTLRECSTI